MIKAVIFDMDGVIVDSEPELVKVEIEYMKDNGVKIVKEDIDEFVGTNSYYMWGELKERYNLNKSVEDLVTENREKYLQHIQNSKNVKSVPGVIELIKALDENGIKMVVASSSPVSWIEKIIDTLDIRDYFQFLISGDYVENSKPDPDIFLFALDKLGVDNKEALVIEDSTNGVKAAIAANIKVIGYKGDETSNQDLSMADKIIKSFDEIELSKLI
ncbi:HAD family phosphatase [Clostridium sp. D2Q-11]|uniref:HAD family phosphatase n=1 Tax=Anaeromonas frigoriresistens TaxID=2683708 RepID=A0A942Z990_9FIRM|nr:HAD family phosphatase [Anaeromonas frigoriresistens]MBS4538869.1 HAD family phosphatase [Anaeromonas frigoriresistens]